MPENFKHLSEKYLAEFYDFHQYDDITGFAYTSRLHAVIALEIALSSFDNLHWVSFEYLCEKIPKKLGKRTTIQTILNEGVRKSFFIKTISFTDNRVKIYKLEEESLKNIQSWLSKHFNTLDPKNTII